MTKIINFRYTNSLDNKGIILTGEEDESFDSEKEALGGAQSLIDETPDNGDVYVWEDSSDKWHVGW